LDVIKNRTIFTESNKTNRMKKVSIDEHRKGLKELYFNQLLESGNFMMAVLTEAIRKLNYTDIDPKKIEDWVTKLEKLYRKTL
jgi:hypothetical protein